MWSAGFVDDGDVMGIGVGVDPGDDFQMLVCHDETGPAFRCVRWDMKGHAGRVGRQDSNGILRTGSYEVMSTWPPRLLQSVLRRTDHCEDKPLSERQSHPESHRNTTNSIITVHTLGFGFGCTGLRLGMFSREWRIPRWSGWFESHLGHVFSLFRGFLASECAQIVL